MTEANITPEVEQNTQEYIDRMVAKGEGRELPEEPTEEDFIEEEEEVGEQEEQEEQPERPAWLPEKFKSAEDMAKAYAALEGKLGSTDGEEEEGEADLDQEEADEAAEAAVEAAGLDMDALGQKMADNGELDDSDYEALEKAGISRQMVEAYVTGQQALGAQMVSRMHETVGGEENFNGILEWASENLDPEDVEAFNNTVDTGSENAVRLALRGLHAQYNAAGGKAPKLIGGQRAPSVSSDVFNSVAEMTRAMNDPRYQTDNSYRAAIAAKLDRSSIF